MSGTADPSRSPLVGPVAEYYSGRLERYGATPAGVDWNSAESQRLRFAQFDRLFGGERRFSLLDYGCGYGAYARYLAEGGLEVEYTGFDVSEAMVDAARDHLDGIPRCSFASERAALAGADYVVASGLFNVRLDARGREWAAYVRATIDDMAALARRGFGFNALTAYADPERTREDLFYASPTEMFDVCIRRYGRDVALLHDYGLYEFTVLVRLDGRSPAPTGAALPR